MGSCVLITHGIGDCRDMMKVSFPRTWEWCRKHGVGFEGSTRREAPHCGIYWDKVAMIRRILPKLPLETLVIWMDADCMICNPDASPIGVLSEPYALGMRRVLVKATGKLWWNAGVIFIRNTPEAQAFFESAWGMRDDPRFNTTDEIAMNHLIDMGFPCYELPKEWNAVKEAENAIIRGFHTWPHERVIEKLVDEQSAQTRRIKIKREG